MKDDHSEWQTICVVLEIAHRALRCVDASDTTKPQTADTLARVAMAVGAVEIMARELGYVLHEFRRPNQPEKV